MPNTTGLNVFDLPAIPQGATWTQVVVWQAGDPLAPVDLTNYSAAMQLRTRADAAGVAATLSTASGGITISAPAGQITLALTAAQTGAISAGSYVYDLELTAPDFVTVTRLLQGQVCVNANVTR